MSYDKQFKELKNYFYNFYDSIPQSKINKSKSILRNEKDVFILRIVAVDNKSIPFELQILGTSFNLFLGKSEIPYCDYIELRTKKDFWFLKNELDNLLYFKIREIISNEWNPRIVKLLFFKGTVMDHKYRFIRGLPILSIFRKKKIYDYEPWMS